MMPSFRTDTAAADCRRALLSILLAVLGLAVALGWHHAALAGERTEAAGKAVGEPSFDLPPIVVQVSEAGRAQRKTMVFKAALVFDETDEDRINDSQRIVKTLMPKIMDSVITGVQGHRFEADPNFAEVNQVILDRSAAVLQPYGVVIKFLRIEHLGNR